jgi:hypothetical protein
MLLPMLPTQMAVELQTGCSPDTAARVVWINGPVGVDRHGRQVYDVSACCRIARNLVERRRQIAVNRLSMVERGVL